MSNYMGIDIGYSNVKCVYGNSEGAISHDVFPIGSMPSDQFKEIFMSVGGDAIRVMEVNVDGKMYSVGFEPSKVPGLSRSVTESYIDSEQYKSLFHAALLHAQDNHISNLVTGLPVSHFKDENTRKRLEALMLGEHKVAPMRTVTVENVEVIPQPGGALISVIEELESNQIKEYTANNASNREGIKANSEELADMISIGKTLVIDPGFYSLDYVSFSEGVLDHSISGSSLLASSRIMEKAAELISKDIGSPIGKEMKREAVEEAIRLNKEKLIHFGNFVKVADYVKKASQLIGDAAVKEISGHLRDTNIDVVILAGGGSSLFLESVRKEFKGQHIVVSSNPVEAIAKGYFSWASRA